MTAHTRTPLVIMDEDGYFYLIFQSGVAAALKDDDLTAAGDLLLLREAEVVDKSASIAGPTVTICNLVKCVECDYGWRRGDVLVYPEDDCGTYTVPTEYASLSERRSPHKILEDREYECRSCGGYGRVYEPGQEKRWLSQVAA